MRFREFLGYGEQWIPAMWSIGNGSPFQSKGIKSKYLVDPGFRPKKGLDDEEDEQEISPEEVFGIKKMKPKMKKK